MARGSPEPVAGKCGALLRNSRTGWHTPKWWREQDKVVPTTPARYCTQTPMSGRERCKFHGGKAPVGPASATWKTGVHSKWLRAKHKNTPLLTAYEETIRDPNLRSVREQIAVATGLEVDVLQRLGSGVSLDAWVNAQSLMRRADLALRAQDSNAMVAAMAELRAVLFEGSKAARAFMEALEVLDLNRRLRLTEGKLREQEERQVSLDELVVLARTVAELALRYIANKEDRRAFSHDIRALLTAGPAAALHELRGHG